MSFITGPVSNANPGPTLYALIETAALAQGWTLVDTVVIGSNTHKVLKSAGASGGNTYGLDWYLDINYPTTGTTGGIRFAPFEGYNATTHVATNGPYGASSDATVNQTTFSRFGTTGSALETNWYNTSGYTSLSTVLSTAFTYFISITRDGIGIILTSDPTSLSYTGYYTPTSAHSTAAGAALFPLIMTKMTPMSTGASTLSQNNALSSAAVTRMPNAPTGSWFTWGASAIIAGGALLPFTTGQIGGTGISPLTGDQSIASGMPIYSGANVVSSASNLSSTIISALVGTMPATIGLGVTGSSVIVGNTVTIGSDTWYSTSYGSGVSLFLKGV